MHETSYIATPEFDATVAWKTHRYGDVLVDKAAVARVRETADAIREDAVIIVVGVVEPERLYVSPMGNFNSQYGMDFHKTKFQLSLRRPTDVDFGLDFELAVKKLEKLQDAIARMDNKRYLVLRQGGDVSLRFSSPMFELKVCQNPPAPLST